MYKRFRKVTGVWSEIEYFIIRLFYSYIKFTNFILVRIFNRFPFPSLSRFFKEGVVRGRDGRSKVSRVSSSGGR